MSNQPKTAYVCLISEHNIAELESCLYHQPSDIVLVVTTSMDKHANHFHRVIQEKLPNSQIHHPYDANFPLQGDNVANTKTWIANVLTPTLNHLQAARYGLNLTGGTKLLALGIAQSREWDWIDYKSFGKKDIGIFYQSPTASPALPDTIPAPIVQIADAARLYVEDYLPSTEKWAAVDLAHRQHLAQKIWYALEGEQHASDPVLATLFKYFSQQWYGTAFTDTLPVDDPALAEWVKAFDTLLPGSIALDNDGRLFLSKSGKSKAWQKWISGGWLEELAYGWLIEEGMNDTQIALNVTNHRNSEQGREVDIIGLLNGQLFIVEAKADKQPEQSNGQLVQQLLSIDVYGKSKKILLLGPEARRTMQRKGEQQRSWQDFEARCQASFVKLACSRPELIKSVFNR